MKINVFGIVRDHLATLYDTGQPEKISRGDVCLFYLLPFVPAGLVAFTDWRVSQPDSLLNLIGILFGFLASIYFFVVDRDGSRAEPGAIGKQLFREVRATVGYCNLVLLGLLTLLIEPAIDADEGALSCWMSTVLVYLLAHFALTMLMVVKRLDSIFVPSG